MRRGPKARSPEANPVNELVGLLRRALIDSDTKHSPKWQEHSSVSDTSPTKPVPTGIDTLLLVVHNAYGGS